MEINVATAKKELQDLVAKQKESVMSEEQKKAQEPDRIKQQEEKVKADEAKAADDAILAKKEEERTQEEKDRAKTVLEEKAKAELKAKEEEEAKLSADEKIKRIQEKSQKRIDEVLNEIKQLKDQGSAEATELKAKLEKLEADNKKLSQQIPQPRDVEIESTLRKQEQDRLAKYLEVDQDKPREQRREMSKDELDEWVMEDLAAATEWMVERRARRKEEAKADKDRLSRQDVASEFIEQQKESLKRVIAKHPDLDVKKRGQELRAQGMSEKEITETILKENDKFRLLTEITRSDSKYLTSENGPELAVAEMEKRLGKTGEQSKIDELTRKIEEMSAELAAMNSDEGIGSSVPRPRITKEKLSESEEQIVSMMKKSNAPQKNIDSAIEKFRTSKGINAGSKK